MTEERGEQSDQLPESQPDEAQVDDDASAEGAARESGSEQARQEGDVGDDEGGQATGSPRNAG